MAGRNNGEHYHLSGHAWSRHRGRERRLRERNMNRCEFLSYDHDLDLLASSREVLLLEIGIIRKYLQDETAVDRNH